MGCDFTSPGDYEKCSIDDCLGESGLPVGVYNASYTFTQGMATTPTVPGPAPSSSQCTSKQLTSSGVTYSWADPNVIATGPCSQVTYGTTSTPTPTGSISATAKSNSSSVGNDVKSLAVLTFELYQWYGIGLTLLGIFAGALLL